MHSIPRPAFTLILLLIAAGLALAGGVWLARRPVEHRIPADRVLLREAGAALQAELARLDALYLAHLQRLAGRLEAGETPRELRPAADNVRGIALFGVLSVNPKAPPLLERIPEPGSLPPQPELTTGGKSASPFHLAIPREAVFGESTKVSVKTDPAAAAPALPEEREGWISAGGNPQRTPWTAWWRRLEDGRSVAVFVLNREGLQTAVNGQITRLLPAVWSPVRAAGGLDRLEGPDRRTLAGLPEAPDRPPDFVVPLASRLGDWQIVSWDRREMKTVFDSLTLTVAGVLAACLTLLGAVTAAAQRRALREVTARVSFVNRVSHELAAPLTNLQLSLELARDALPDQTPPEAVRRLDIALEESARLRRLTENVLTFARSGRKSLTVNPVSLPPAAVIAGVLEQFAPALARRGITVETDFDETTDFVADADALAQIAGNLVSNVEKYAASGGLLRVELQRDEAAGRLLLRVMDRGPGIPAAESERVFLPFERLDSRITEGVSGAGLGLAIARDLARRMGGDVRLRTSSEQAKGAVFEVILPVPSGIRQVLTRSG